MIKFTRTELESLGIPDRVLDAIQEQADENKYTFHKQIVEILWAAAGESYGED